ncbi:PAS domain S-box protein [Flavihumibacter sp. UBA7668]|uniref:PAS domain S-box protein n=1 Tax=Flavihumibacter sp. UBA7668 TaxID=1946542 RepID=UPI0025C1F22E|nr:PAS domain S-box protein [Flavihumibacter sp. UBA7668]
MLELQIREILESISDAFYALDNNWNFTYFNKEAENLLLKRADEVLGKNIWELFPASVHTPIRKIYQKVARTKKKESFEYYFPGDGKWYEINAYPSNGGISAYFKNIDERKMAAVQLEKAHQEKIDILESIGDAFFYVNKDWVITYCNKETERILGKKRVDLIGKNLWEEYPEAVDTAIYHQYHRALETKEHLTFEEFYKPMQIWLELTVYPSPNGLSVNFKDITQRKEADLQLKQSNERFEKVTEATHDAIWDWNIIENTLYWGAGFKILFGYQIEKITPTLESWSNHIHPEDQEWVLESIYGALDKVDQSNWVAEYRYQKSDGSFADVIDRGVVIRDEKGKPIRMVGAMNDVTEKKQLSIQLDRERLIKQQEITDAVITAEENERQEIGRELHDNIQQILVSSRLFLTMVEEKDISKTGYSYLQETNKLIMSAIEEIRKLSHSMITPFVEKTTLKEAIDKLVINTAGATGLQIKLDIRGLDETKLSEKLRLTTYRIIQEQFNNILKYAKASTVLLKLVQEQEQLVLKIMDDGIGVDLSKKTTGIGLMNIKTRASLFDGEVVLHSEPGNGFELLVRMRLY